MPELDLSVEMVVSEQPARQDPNSPENERSAGGEE
jgi:hypothetical protein